MLIVVFFIFTNEKKKKKEKHLFTNHIFLNGEDLTYDTTNLRKYRKFGEIPTIVKQPYHYYMSELNNNNSNKIIEKANGVIFNTDGIYI